MLEVSIVDAKVGKFSWINIFNFHHGGGGRCRDGDGPLARSRTAEVTNDNSERADCIKCLLHNRRYHFSVFILLPLCRPATSAHRYQTNTESILRQAPQMW